MKHYGVHQQQFAVGVNEVTRGLERMPPSISPGEQLGMNVDDGEARGGFFQVSCRVKLYSLGVCFLFVLLALNLCVFCS